MHSVYLRYLYSVRTTGLVWSRQHTIKEYNLDLYRAAFISYNSFFAVNRSTRLRRAVFENDL